MTIREKFQESWNPELVGGFYNESGGLLKPFRRAVRGHYSQATYALDPMTIMLLVQMAIKLYFWAKQQGFLTAIPSTAMQDLPKIVDLEQIMVGDLQQSGDED